MPSTSSQDKVLALWEDACMWQAFETGVCILQWLWAPHIHLIKRPQFSSVQSLSRVRHFATPWTAARQASLSITNSWSLLKLMSIELVMPSNHLILCHPLLLWPSIFPSIRVFSNESVLCIRWPKYWSFSFSILFLVLLSLPGLNPVQPLRLKPSFNPCCKSSWISLSLNTDSQF